MFTTYVNRVPTPGNRRNESLPSTSKDRSVIHQNSRHSVEVFAPLPNVLKEKLANLKDFTLCSAQITETGVCWVVCESCIYVFTLKGSLFVSLELPSSRFSVLVSLVTSHTGIALMVCSSEGNINYWENIEQKSKIVTTLNLPDGVLATHAISCQPLGFLIGLNNGSVCRLSFSNGSSSVHYLQQTTQSSYNMLYGLGKIFWGTKEYKNFEPVKKLCKGKFLDGTILELFVLTSARLQKWHLEATGKEKLIFDYSLLDAVKRRLCTDEELHNVGLDLQVWLQDISYINELFVLAASITTDCPPDKFRLVTYSILEIVCDNSMQPKLHNAFSLKYEPPYEVANEDVLIHSAHLEIVRGGTAFVWCPNVVVLTKVPFDDQPLDVIPLRPNDSIIGSGVVDDKMLFISEKYNVVSVTQLGEKTLDHMEQSASHRDRLVASFKTFTTGDKEASRMLQSLFATLKSTELSELVVLMSSEILDAHPLNDPRWAEEHSFTSTNYAASSLLIRQQLEEKKRKHALFLNMLTFCNVFDQMTTSARKELTRHVEKLSAAVQLRNHQNLQEQSSAPLQLFRRAIDKCIASRKYQSAFTTQDLFYTEVTHIEEILYHLRELLREPPPDPTLLEQCYADLDQVNQIFEVILTPLSAVTVHSVVANTRYTVRYIVDRQREIIFSWINELQSSSVIPTLFSKLYFLTDVALNAYIEEIQQQGEIEETALLEYDSYKTHAIEPFVQYNSEMAVKLADKYKAFDMLAILCANDPKRREYFMDKFKQEEFPSYMFKFYYEQKRFSDLLEQPSEYDQQLQAFLVSMPDLSWLHAIKMKQFNTAAAKVYELSLRETKSFERRKTLLSVSKLAGVVASNEGLVARASQHLYLLKAHERLQSFPLNSAPEELITHFYNKESPTKSDILHALDVYANATLLLQPPEKNMLKAIWQHCFAVYPWDALAADWDKGNLDDSRVEVKSAIKGTIFYQVAKDQRVVANHLLPVESLAQLLVEYQSSRGSTSATLTRLLNSVYSLIQSEMS